MERKISITPKKKKRNFSDEETHLLPSGDSISDYEPKSAPNFRRYYDFDVETFVVNSYPSQLSRNKLLLNDDEDIRTMGLNEDSQAYKPDVTSTSVNTNFKRVESISTTTKPQPPSSPQSSPIKRSGSSTPGTASRNASQKSTAMPPPKPQELSALEKTYEW